MSATSFFLARAGMLIPSKLLHWIDFHSFFYLNMSRWINFHLCYSLKHCSPVKLKLKVAQKSFQHFPRRRFWRVIITTLYQLMLQSWYQKTAQSLVNTLLFSWHNRLPYQHYDLLKTPLISALSASISKTARMRCNFWQGLKKNSVHGALSHLKFSNFFLFLPGHSVAIVTYWVTKIIPTCAPMIGQFFDTMIVASTDKEW